MRHMRFRRRAAVPLVQIIGGTVGVIGIGVLGWLIFRTTPEKMLDLDALTPDQVKIVATKLLLDEDIKVRDRASTKLASLGKSAAEPLKEVCLTNSDPKVRLATFEVLMAVDKDASMEVIQKMSSESDVGIRTAAVEAAIRLDDPRTVAVLEKAIKDSDPHIRQTAVGGMITKKDAKNSISALEQALRDDNITTRRHAARSLQMLTGKSYQVQEK